MLLVCRVLRMYFFSFFLKGSLVFKSNMNRGTLYLRVCVHYSPPTKTKRRPPQPRSTSNSLYKVYNNVYNFFWIQIQYKRMSDRSAVSFVPCLLFHNIICQNASFSYTSPVPVFSLWSLKNSNVLCDVCLTTMCPFTTTE